ncbi:MAG: aldehyde dehydrogenase family protein [Gaiella sp.]|nr:aldehyde dehydrogenase family protein [Gaiella sp.]
MGAPGSFRPPTAVNEPIRSYEPGSPERAELQRRLAEMSGERLHIPLVIGGERVEAETTYEAVMPHDRDHVLADVAKGDASHVERAIAAARAAHAGWASTPGTNASRSSSARRSCSPARGARHSTRQRC